MKNKNESASLAFNDLATGGSSDKVYFLNLEQTGAYGTFNVTAQYGRRGGPLATDKKTKNGALVYDQAKKLFDRVKREKIAKGYRELDAPAPAAQIAEGESDTTSCFAQELLSEISESEALKLVASPAYYMQDKSDGHARGVVKVGGTIFGLNKLGRRVPLPAHLHDALSKIKLRTFQIDAELVGDRLVCRDLLNADGDIDSLPYETRFRKLIEAIMSWNAGDTDLTLSVVETWDGAKNKAAALAQSRADRREGVVFKLKSAPHRSGRNGQHKKFKFVKTLSAIAGKPHANGKASVEIFLIDGDVCADKVRVANVSLIGKTKVIEGDVLEVAYLYAFPSKKLCQARLLRKRDDVHFSECTTAQLIFKREE